jgi:proteasome lid subunit RPN8/RPN11
MQELPREACAVIIIEKGRERLVICKNVSVVNDQFILDPLGYAAAEDRGEIIGIVHSHCFVSSRPSGADRVACEASGLEWHICSVPTGSWFSFKPDGYKAPFVGREFCHGVLDCYSLIRDYFKETLSIEIPDFERDFEWWELGQSLYLDNFKKAGFREVPMKEIKAHDVLLMQIHSRIVNHGAVYLGNDLMLHHLSKRLSAREVFGGYYKKHTQKVVRHENC